MNDESTRKIRNITGRVLNENGEVGNYHQTITDNTMLRVLWDIIIYVLCFVEEETKVDDKSIFRSYIHL